MEYSRQRAVADTVNVDGLVYEIRTRITAQGSTIEAGNVVKQRDRKTRAERWEQLDEDLEYSASQLDREVVAQDQIRTVVRAFRDRLFTDLFPGRTHVPKTIVFAKDDAHAEAIVRAIREEFDKGNDFCKKITYRVTGISTDELIAEFRNSYNPRIAVSVDMISTGTDIKPVECLLFMRLVKSRVLFEQMVGRGTRVISDNDLLAVTPDAENGKDHFLIVDTVGIAEHPLIETEPLERKRTVPFKALIEQVAWGLRDEDSLASLAGRLARLQRKLTPQDEYAINAVSSGLDLRAITHQLLDAIDPDRIAQRAGASPAPTDATPTEEQLAQAATQLAEDACRIFDEPNLRNTLIDIQQRDEQTVDVVSLDEVQLAGYSDSATAQAMQTVESFRQYIIEHKDEIAALDIIYRQPYQKRHLTYEQVKELSEHLKLPPNVWTTESLWRAYAQLERDKVRGVGGKRVLTDLVSLVRHAVHLDDELEPYPDQVQRRYQDWLAAQEQAGQAFTPEQRWWLDEIAEHIGVNVDITPKDFNYGEFQAKGGRIAAVRVFGPEFWQLVEQLNAELVV